MGNLYSITTNQAAIIFSRHQPTKAALAAAKKRGTKLGGRRRKIASAPAPSPGRTNLGYGQHSEG
jgi:hypothetical protein